MLESKRKMSLSEQAYNQIKDAICSGKVAPNDILSEGEIAAQLGMSRTPVREALRTLASEDFVEVRNGVGAFVKTLSSKDMEDLYEVRCVLETQAIKTSVFRITTEEIDEFERRFQAMSDACERGTHLEEGEFSELDWQFHSLLVERCTNKYIKSILHSYVSNLRRYMGMSVDVLNDVHVSAQQHLSILQTLRTRDPKKAAEALRVHLEWSAGLLHIDV